MINQIEIEFFNTVQSTPSELVEYTNRSLGVSKQILDLMSDGKFRTWFEVKDALPKLNEISIKRTLSTKCTKIEDRDKMLMSPSKVMCHKYKL